MWFILVFPDDQRKNEVGTMQLLILAGLAAVLGLPQSDEPGLKAGDMTPGFRMLGSDDEWYTSEQFKGEQAFIVAWFPKAFTGG